MVVQTDEWISDVRDPEVADAVERILSTDDDFTRTPGMQQAANVYVGLLSLFLPGPDARYQIRVSIHESTGRLRGIVTPVTLAHGHTGFVALTSVFGCLAHVAFVQENGHNFVMIFDSSGLVGCYQPSGTPSERIIRVRGDVNEDVVSHLEAAGAVKLEPLMHADNLRVCEELTQRLYGILGAFPKILQPHVRRFAWELAYHDITAERLVAFEGPDPYGAFHSEAKVTYAGLYASPHCHLGICLSLEPCHFILRLAAPGRDEELWTVDDMGPEPRLYSLTPGVENPDGDPNPWGVVFGELPWGELVGGTLF